MASKKVGVMTFHIAHNHGAMLQAYALPKAVQKLGHSCEVIDYRFPYIYNWGRSINFAELMRTHGCIKGCYHFARHILAGSYNPARRYNKFNYFREHVMPRSEKVYRSPEELDNMNYDAVLFGSDQIWNENLTNGVAGEYYGQFKCDAKLRKIAYAASCGGKQFYEEAEKVAYGYIDEFYALGIREEGLTKSLQDKGYKATQVLDPSLLLNKNEWLEMVDAVPNKIDIPKKYMLIYAFDEDEKLYDLAREYAAEKKLEILVIAYDKKDCMYGTTVLTDCGPADFVNLIANAEFVVTTSFHGTAFSILLEKEFCCIPHPIYHERTDSLLKLLDLESRNVLIKNGWDKLEDIEWNSIKKLLEEERRDSMEFLRNALADN